MISNGKSNGTTSIEKVSDNIAVDKKVSKMDAKGVHAIVDMEYTTGDRLKFTGISGIYSTVKMDIPATNKTISFNFIACTDGDNNNYPVVEIGTQVWMAENLKTTKYRDGTVIPNVTVNTDWRILTTPAYCWYNNNEASYKATFGALYNWYTVSTGNLCPMGWHIPGDDEWTILTTYLGGTTVAGGKLKETGTTRWNSPNTGATSETGFTALPGGYRINYGAFGFLGNYGYWWSSTEYIFQFTALARTMFYSTNTVGTPINSENSGFSVRCLKD